MREIVNRIFVLPALWDRHFGIRCGILGGYLCYLLLWLWLGLPCWAVAIFGIPCPGCGMSRALFALLRLDVAGAFGWHMMVWSLPALLWALFTDGRIFRNRRINGCFWILVGAGFLFQWGKNLFL